MRAITALKLTALLALLACTPAAAAVKNVAVVETEIDAASGAAAELNPAEVRQVTTELRREAVKNLPRDKYNIMTTETVMAQGGAVLEECSEENCVIALGSMIGADYIVRGTISKLQTRFTLSVEMYETENGNLVALSDPVRSENIGDLIERAAAACAEMYKAFAGPQAARAAAARYIVTADASPVEGGYVSRSPNKAVYNAGEQLTLTAVAHDGFAFAGWSGASVSANPVLAGSIDSDLSFVAKFHRIYKLSTEIYPLGGGSVSRDPDKSVYAAGERVTVTASPSPGYVFAGWIGASGGESNAVTIKMDGDRRMAARFQAAYRLMINVSPSGGGSVIRNPDKMYYAAGEKVSVTASPEDGYAFMGWSGAVTGRKHYITITMNSDKTLTPSFYLKSIPPPEARRPEPEARPPRAEPAERETPPVEYSAGGALSYAGDFGGGLRWDNGGELAMPSGMTGAHLFFDAAYAALYIGYTQGGGAWESPNAVAPGALPYMFRTAFNFGVFAKYPNLVKITLPVAGTEWSAGAYPVVGIDCEYPAYGKLEFADKPLYIFDGGNPEGYKADALNAVWIKFGGGLDVAVTPKMYARLELMYGVRTAYRLETDQAAKDGRAWTRTGHGLTLKAGAGFKIGDKD